MNISRLCILALSCLLPWVAASQADETPDQVTPLGSFSSINEDAEHCNGEALDVWRDGMSARQAALAVADALEALYTRVGVPTRLRQLEIPREELRNIANDTVKNFNANAGERLPADRIEEAMRLLEAA